MAVDSLREHSLGSRVVLVAQNSFLHPRDLSIPTACQEGSVIESELPAALFKGPQCQHCCGGWYVQPRLQGGAESEGRPWVQRTCRRESGDKTVEDPEVVD